MPPLQAVRIAPARTTLAAARNEKVEPFVNLPLMTSFRPQPRPARVPPTPSACACLKHARLRGVCLSGETPNPKQPWRNVLEQKEPVAEFSGLSGNAFVDKHQMAIEARRGRPARTNCG